MAEGDTFQQKYLNVPIRGEGYLDIIMYIPDNSVNISDVTSNDILETYSNLGSLKDIKKFTNTTIATLEENLWLLNGAFINPTPGRVYDGYISNSVSNADGEFATNPTLDLTLGKISDIKYFSIVLNPAVKSGYPKKVKVILMNSENIEVESFSKDISQETALPNLVFDINRSGISKIKIEFIGTLYPQRRIRVSNIMFGRILNLTQNDILSSDYTDKCSYVADSIPSRTFNIEVSNYDKKYNIDNPENVYATSGKDTVVIIRNGYNIAGFTTVEDGNGNKVEIINNPNNDEDIVWDDWKELRLLGTSTSSGDTCTFECGSILDTMTDTYTNEYFINNRTVIEIVNALMDFEKLPRNTVDCTDIYKDKLINNVIPELPVREILQLLAFSIGATLLIKDDGTIKFASLNLNEPTSFTHHHDLSYVDFLEVPAAEQLAHTDKISLPKYNAIVSEGNVETIGTVNVSAYNTEVTYSMCQPTNARVDTDKDTTGASVASAELYSTHGFLQMNLPVEGEVPVIIEGHKITVETRQDRKNTSDTLIIDTKLMKEDPDNAIKIKYREWYNLKFKYFISTRGEPLIDAGDYATIQTPFNDSKNGYVLSNHVAFNGTWSGDMEVITIE